MYSVRIQSSTRGNSALIDFHTHILPVIDDFSRDIDETLLMLKEAKDAALNNYFKSYKYEFKFYKENDNYIWKKFERNKTSSGIIVD